MADQASKASQCTAISKTTGNHCTRPPIPGGSVTDERGLAQQQQDADSMSQAIDQPHQIGMAQPRTRA